MCPLFTCGYDANSLCSRLHLLRAAGVVRAPVWSGASFPPVDAGWTTTLLLRMWTITVSPKRSTSQKEYRLRYHASQCVSQETFFCPASILLTVQNKSCDIFCSKDAKWRPWLNQPAFRDAPSPPSPKQFFHHTSNRPDGMVGELRGRRGLDDRTDNSLLGTLPPAQTRPAQPGKEVELEDRPNGWMDACMGSTRGLSEGGGV